MAVVRPYRESDRSELYDVCLRTGADGEDASALYTDQNLLGEVFVGPYLALTPDLAWVAEHEGRASGYVLGTADTTWFLAECERAWWPRLRARYPLDGFPAGSLEREVVGLLYEPPAAPDWIVEEYPAHLHIDLLPEVQGSGTGGVMMRTLLDALEDRGASAVHLDVSPANTRAIGFYHHLGFATLDASDPGGTIMGAHLPLLRA